MERKKLANLQEYFNISIKHRKKVLKYIINQATQFSQGSRQEQKITGESIKIRPS